MSRGVGSTLALCVTFVALVLGALFYNATRTPLLSAEGLRQQGAIILPEPRALTDFALLDHTGANFKRKDLLGKWNLLYFGYTFCPDVCPVTLSVLAKMEQQLRADGEQELFDKLRVILVTVDPERDDAAVLSRYLGAFSERFVGLTGSPEAIADLAQQLYVAFAAVPGQGGSYLVDHSANIVMINPRGHYIGIIRPPHEPPKLRLILQSLAAAAGG